MRILRAFAVLAIASGLASCAGEETRPTPGRPSTAARRPSPPPTRQPALSAAEFVAQNGSIDLFVIRSSELALQRSSSARIREFAERLIADHKGTSGQLSLQGRRLNLLPSATVRPNEQAMLESLQASSRFDAEYVRDMRVVHERAISIDSAYAASGRSPTLRPVAAAALPTEQRHLRLLAYL